ncbi:hypothetical protein IFJ82_09865 [Novacetimonas hansenii]|uniref:hypothetical protein n=1 Tax=Novacetimonas hansenii TaxID=436 RepID=UPI00178013B7|nr:hypothetical protein [Novacetimonas hansenii]QOF94257.1 hypothetical protein IFJ82_09865 [Novacetimonas hansenii]
MGEIADMMLDGTLDCMTGEYIGDPCGYPRTFEEDESHATASKRKKRSRKSKKKKVDAA